MYIFKIFKIYLFIYLLSFDIWYLFTKFSLVFEVEVVRNDEDIATKDGKITW
jgi:hypothetical protein